MCKFLTKKNKYTCIFYCFWEKDCRLHNCANVISGNCRRQGGVRNAAFFESLTSLIKEVGCPSWTSYSFNRRKVRDSNPRYDVMRTPHFECGSFDHSDNFPKNCCKITTKKWIAQKKRKKSKKKSLFYVILRFLWVFAQLCERNFGGIAGGKAASESTVFFHPFRWLNSQPQKSWL